MPQLQLPIFPKGLTCITEDLAFQQEDGKVVYFHGLLPVFQHDQEDLKSFRMFTSQLIANGTVRQRDISACVRCAVGNSEAIPEGASAKGCRGFLSATATALGDGVDTGGQAASTGIVGRGQERTGGEQRDRC